MHFALFIYALFYRARLTCYECRTILSLSPRILCIAVIICTQPFIFLHFPIALKSLPVNMSLKTVQITIFYYCYLILLVPSSLADEMVIKQ